MSNMASVLNIVPDYFQPAYFRQICSIDLCGTLLGIKPASDRDGDTPRGTSITAGQSRLSSVPRSTRLPPATSRAGLAVSTIADRSVRWSWSDVGQRISATITTCGPQPGRPKTGDRVLTPETKGA